jgi:hypothetical protein
MNAVGEFDRKHVLNAPLAGNAPQSLERGAHHLDTEVRLRAAGSTGMAAMGIRLILNGEPERRERGGELLLDGAGNGSWHGWVRIDETGYPSNVVWRAPPVNASSDSPDR